MFRRAPLKKLAQLYAASGRAAFSAGAPAGVLVGIGQLSQALSSEYNEDTISPFGGDTLSVDYGPLAALDEGRKLEVESATVTDVVFAVPFASRAITVGRASRRDVVIPEYSISAEHCDLIYHGQYDARLVNARHSNGTWVVCDERAAAVDDIDGVRLRGGERIVLGRFVFRFLYCEQLLDLLAEHAPVPDAEPLAGTSPVKKKKGLLGRLFGKG